MAYVTSSGSSFQIVIRGLGGGVDQTSEVQAAIDKCKALSYNYATAPPVGPVPEIVIHGVCGITSGLNAFAMGPMAIRGSSPGSGFMAMSAGTYDMLTIGNGLAGGYGSYITVKDLTFNSNGQKTGGAGIKLYTASSCHIEGCSLWYQYDGIRTERGSQQNQIRNNSIFLFSRYGLYCGVTGVNTPTWGYGTEQHFIDNYVYSGDPAGLGTGCVGIFHDQGDACHYRGNDSVACGIGVIIAPSFTPQPEIGHMEFSNNVISDSQSHCMIVDGTFAAAKLRITNNDLVYSMVTGHGLRLLGGNLKNILVQGNFIHGCASGGIYLASDPRDVVIDSNIITGNGTAGIITQSGAQAFKITNNRIHTTGGSGYSGSQTYGVNWGGSHENYMFAMNDLRGNATGATTGTPGGSNFVNANNLS